ncbi:ion channel [Maribacter cobaltidurans]|uniref:K+ channel, inward rectifier n=1 Tax=Maribacter cobaltidurans TaxID=1178778 RepID=A0A223V4T6_9FLAO|nr:ion channel [Maribacter cobaltidurans]ASV30322.1 K+ channel, inward rectifier [Maribacter cobaltidurans]GGD77595.1 inward rectifier potassium channel Irk [Maribacter cobaltidurans]
MKRFKKEKYDDLGLDTKSPSNGYRALNKDGTFNVRKENVSFFERMNIFHSVVSMPWLQFFLILGLGYFIINIVFASLYLIIGTEHLTGIYGTTKIDQFIEAFFFSAQTITTLGYGQIAPLNLAANIVAATESLLGLLLFALATGLMYGRFSKPFATIKYSTVAVIAPYNEINGFMFRVVNPKSNQLLEVEVNVNLSIKRENSDLRDFYSLELERSKVVFFPTMWTIVHPISQNSPIYGLKKENLLEKDAEFIVVIKAFDESFSQSVYSRSSYKAEEIKWGEKFAYLAKRDESGISIDVGRIDETFAVDLN